MADKKIRDYIPGQDNFLNFAQTMNNNAQIDFQRNKVTAGKVVPEMKPVTSDASIGAVAGEASMQTRPIGAQAYTEIRGGFKKVLDDSAKGIDTKYTSVITDRVFDVRDSEESEETKNGKPGLPNVVDEVNGVNDGGLVSGGDNGLLGNGQSDSVNGGSVIEESVIDEPSVEEPIIEDSTAEEPIIEEPSGNSVETVSNKLSYEDWMSQNGYDPESDYDMARNELEYEFKTYLSTYGARAEELYQMGLSGSGISDVYGVNAYSAYLAASNDLALAKIEQENEYRRLYQEYSEAYDNEINQKITDGYNQYAATYKPENSQNIYNELMTVYELTEQEATTVIKKLQSSYEAGASERFDSSVQGAIQWLNENYTHGMTEDEIKGMLGSEYDEAVVAAALEKFTPYKEYIDRQTTESQVQSALEWMLNSNETDPEKLKAQAAAIYGDSAAEAAAERYAPLAGGNAEQIINDAATLFAYQDGEYAYDGSESYKNYIRQMLNTSAYSMYAPYADEIIAKMDENLKANQDAVVEDATNKLDATASTSPESLVMSTIVAEFNDISDQLTAGEITQEQYDQYAQSYSNAAIKAYEWATKSADNLAKAYAMFGYDESEWAGMDDGEREAAIMDAMAEYRNEGLVSEASYNSLVSDWAVSELTTYKETSPSDVFESAGAIVSDLSTFPVSSSARDEIINTIIGEIGLNLQDLMLSWSINGKTKQAGVDLIRGSLGKGTTDVRGELLKAGYYSPYGTERYSVYNGKIYVSFDDAGETWYEISEKNLNFIGDARGIAKAEMTGIYAIIARLIEGKLQQPKDTRR